MRNVMDVLHLVQSTDILGQNEQKQPVFVVSLKVPIVLHTHINVGSRS